MGKAINIKPEGGGKDIVMRGALVTYAGRTFTIDGIETLTWYCAASSLREYYFTNCGAKKVKVICSYPINNTRYAFANATFEELEFDADFSTSTFGDSTFWSTTVKRITGEYDCSSISADSSDGFFYSCPHLVSAEIFKPNTLSVTYNLRGVANIDNASLINYCNALKDGVTDKPFKVMTSLAQRMPNIMGNVDTSEGYNFFIADEEGDTSLETFVSEIKGWEIVTI